jgi:hypothetical protein
MHYGTYEVRCIVGNLLGNLRGVTSPSSESPPDAAPQLTWGNVTRHYQTDASSAPTKVDDHGVHDHGVHDTAPTGELRSPSGARPS